jgi:hypothetical protein
MSFARRPIDISLFSSDRRSRQRFPLNLAVEYKLLGRAERFGTGLTRNISSSGALIEVADRQPLSGSIELTMSWPCLLDGACSLKLLMKGRVVRHERSGIAIEARQYEFRTAGLAGGGHRQNVTFLLSNT